MFSGAFWPSLDPLSSTFWCQKCPMTELHQNPLSWSWKWPKCFIDFLWRTRTWFETRLCHLGFPLGKEISRHWYVAQFAGSAHWAEPSPLFAHRARPIPLKRKNEYLVLPLGEETAVQAVVRSIVWAFRRLKNPRCREMSARGYALHSVWPQICAIHRALGP